MDGRQLPDELQIVTTDVSTSQLGMLLPAPEKTQHTLSDNPPNYRIKCDILILYNDKLIYVSVIN